MLLLCYPRLLGYTFNPLSVYFCYRADGELALIIYEVRNTFGDIHAYVLPVAGRDQRCRRAATAGQAVLRLALHRDGDALSFPRPAARRQRQLRILETDREGPLLAATFSGRRRALTTAALLRAFFALPLVTLKIVAAIHWEALRLWLKGARLVPRPNAAMPIPTLGDCEGNDYATPALPARAKALGPVRIELTRPWTECRTWSSTVDCPWAI